MNGQTRGSGRLYLVGKDGPEVMVPRGPTWSDRRARINDEIFESEARETLPKDVPRATHLPERDPPPALGVGILLGTVTVLLVVAICLMIGGSL